MATDEGADYSVEELDDSHVRLTVDGHAVDVYVEKRFSTHHHFGQFTSLDHLVEVIRHHRKEQQQAADELEALQRETDRDEDGRG